ncbi:MAG: DUF3179 domain-containing protein [Acidobacteria bacterium]|nr:MAG: DUF3179 domain-containing protein [Acidobacteriota bacterium]
MVWRSSVDGIELTFQLVGINNQNFVMADRQTGTWWQQVTGEAIRGPLAGKRLEPLPWDEVGFAIWRREHPRTQVLAGDPQHHDSYRLGLEAGDDSAGSRGSFPTLGLAAGTALPEEALIVGVELGGSAKAYPLELLAEQTPVGDTLSGEPLLLWVAEDGLSVRGFSRRLDDRVLDFVRPADDRALSGAEPIEPPTTAPLEGMPHAARDSPEATPWRAGGTLIDAQTGSTWSFSGEAISGPLAGRRLERLRVLKDYWFDWQAYNLRNAIYSGGRLGG